MPDAVLALIIAAATTHGANQQSMVNIACNESGFNPYARNGQYIGIFQLGAGMQQRFLGRGYTNVYDPAQQANFVAEVLSPPLPEVSHWQATINLRCGMPVVFALRLS